MPLSLLAENVGTALRMIESTYAKFLAKTRRKLIEATSPKSTGAYCAGEYARTAPASNANPRRNEDPRPRVVNGRLRSPSCRAGPVATSSRRSGSGVVKLYT